MRSMWIAAAFLLGGLAGSAQAASAGPSRLEISNGNGVEGIANDVSNWLNDPEFIVALVGDAPTFRYGQTFILYRAGQRERAERLAELLPVREVLRQTGVLANGIDIRVLLGKDFAHRFAAARAVARMDGTARIEVANGNGVAGMASRMQAFLEDKGGTVVSVTNADSYAYEHSVLYYRPGRRDAAESLAAVLPVLTVELEESAELSGAVDLRMVVGRDFISYDINRLRDAYGSTGPS